MPETATINGRPQRKQLSDQLDRLDTIIDALAEGLPGAVADACRDGARTAVRDALVEIVSNPELRGMLARPRPEPTLPPRPPGLWSRLKAMAAAAREAVAQTIGQIRDAVIGRCRTACDTVAAVGQAAGENLPVRRILLVGLGIGAAIGLAGLIMPQTAAAAFGAVNATITAVAIQTGQWLKRAARRVGLVT